ncbi:hypothetical protein AMJ80_00050 [bacterium SM23_31]|nr:MAG: hypothetical protein AMJ80_00050 [bacterium SM23_31]
MLEEKINKNIAVLVIDDESVVRNACRKILTEEGYKVILAENGREGLEKSEMGIGDVILVDLKMPDISGMEVLKEIKIKFPRKPVIVITGYSTVDSAVEAMKLGAFDYVPKPFTPDELSLIVHKALEKKKLLDELDFLRKELYEKYKVKNIIGKSEGMKEVFRLVSKVANTDSTVLIYGESGTGKEVIAKAIHIQSRRQDKRFLAIDCSALSPTLLESELFGHVKGAFTGAISTKPGIFEIANNGTIFLDEISNISSEIQAKLLRIIEEQEYKPVGGSEMKKIDVRLISATNKDLKLFVKKNIFREDLFYRLNVFPIFLPPLRERKEDIPLLATHFLKLFTKELNKQIDGFSDESMNLFINYHWPGNVRELKNTVERLVITVEDDIIKPEYLSDILKTQSIREYITIPKDKDELRKLKKKIKNQAIAELEKKFLLESLKQNNWNVSRAARETGFQRTNFHTLMRKYKIKLSDKESF